MYRGLLILGDETSAIEEEGEICQEAEDETERAEDFCFV